jgi:hypothetical protein
MNAILESNKSNPTPERPSLLLASDVRAFSTVPTAHVRDLVADGITGNGLAVYFAIADRQVNKSGEYFRSNESLAEETGLKVRTVQSWISKLRKKQYLHVWYINGGRRMRISTKVQAVAPKHATSDTQACNQLHPYKENNIKKTTQQQKVCVSSFSDENTSLFGEGSLRKLVASFDLGRVERGLQAFEAQDSSTIRNPIAWLTKAIRDGYQPKAVQAKGGKFTESALDHLNIIEPYQRSSKDNADRVEYYKQQGLSDSRIAFKIYKGKI